MMEKELPFVSVIVPAKNEQQYIFKCLESLSIQNYPKDKYEVVVIDNLSTDRTAEIAESFDVILRHCGFDKIGAVRNYGVSFSKGDYIAFLDADCVAPEDWIRNSVRILSTRLDIGAVGGYFHCDAESNWLQRGWAPPRVESQEYVSNLATGSLILSRKIFLQFGPFNESISTGEDTELSNKIWLAGLCLLRSYEVSVIHLDFPSSISSFSMRQIRQASNYFQTKRSDIDRMFWGVVVFLVSFVASIVSFVASKYFLASAFTFIYLLCWIALSVRDAWQAKAGCSLLLPILTTRGLYLIARSIGLLVSIRRIFSKDKQYTSGIL